MNIVEALMTSGTAIRVKEKEVLIIDKDLAEMNIPTLTLEDLMADNWGPGPHTAAEDAAVKRALELSSPWFSSCSDAYHATLVRWGIAKFMEIEQGEEG